MSIVETGEFEKFFEDHDEDAVCDVCEMPVEDCVCDDFVFEDEGEDEDSPYH